MRKIVNFFRKQQHPISDKQLLVVKNLEVTEGFVVPGYFPDEILEHIDSDAMTGAVPSEVAALIAGDDDLTNSIFSELVMKSANLGLDVRMHGGTTKGKNGYFLVVCENPEKIITEKELTQMEAAIEVLVKTSNEAAAATNSRLFSMTFDVCLGAEKIKTFHTGTDVAISPDGML